MPKVTNKKLDFYGFYYQDLLYYNNQNEQTTYLKFNHNDKCIVQLDNEAPNYEKLLLSFNLYNDWSKGEHCSRVSNEILKFSTRHGDSAFIYKIHGKNPDKLKVTRQKEGSDKYVTLEFNHSI